MITSLILLAVIVGLFLIAIGVGLFFHTIEKHYPEPKTPTRETQSEYQQYLDETK